MTPAAIRRLGSPTLQCTPVYKADQGQLAPGREGRAAAEPPSPFRNEPSPQVAAAEDVVGGVAEQLQITRPARQGDLRDWGRDRGPSQAATVVVDNCWANSAGSWCSSRHQSYVGNESPRC